MDKNTVFGETRLSAIKEFTSVAAGALSLVGAGLTFDQSPLVSGALAVTGLGALIYNASIHGNCRNEFKAIFEGQRETNENLSTALDEANERLLKSQKSNELLRTINDRYERRENKGDSIVYWPNHDV